MLHLFFFLFVHLFRLSQVLGVFAACVAYSLKVLVFSCLIFLLLSDYNYKMRPLCPWTQDTMFFYEGPQNSMNRRAQNFYMSLRPPKNMNTRFQKKEPKATNIQGT